MSTHVIVSIRDTAVNAFAPPASFPSTAYAIRSFAEQVNNASDPNNNLHKHPTDFELWQLAEWDEATGAYTSNEPRMIARAIDHKHKDNQA